MFTYSLYNYVAAGRVHDFITHNQAADRHWLIPTSDGRCAVTIRRNFKFLTDYKYSPICIL